MYQFMPYMFRAHKSVEIVQPNTKHIYSKFNNLVTPVIELTNNSIIFSLNALKLINAHYGERIAINYLQINNITKPVIGIALTFGEEENGNKLRKNNTISFKGIQQKTLINYGRLFKLVNYKQDLYFLEEINDQNLEYQINN